MNEEILKLAKECGISHYLEPVGTGEMYCYERNLEAFYKAACTVGFNAELEAVKRERDELLEAFEDWRLQLIGTDKLAQIVAKIGETK